jgi:hypothetical protein
MGDQALAFAATAAWKSSSHPHGAAARPVFIDLDVEGVLQHAIISTRSIDVACKFRNPSGRSLR